MSMCYWMIEGVGLNVGEIVPFLNNEKVVQVLIEQLESEPETVESLRQMLSSGDYSEFDVNDYLYGEPFDNLADLLTHCDDTDSITYGDDGEGDCYFYYPPSMPWEMRDTEPKSIQEVHDRIVTAVQKITDLATEEIESIINDDLNVVGFG